MYFVHHHKNIYTTLHCFTMGDSIKGNPSLTMQETVCEMLGNSGKEQAQNIPANALFLTE
jgi:hypothetical protein